MMKQKRSGFILISLLFFFTAAIAFVFFLRGVSAELEEKFNGQIDSIPTKVYSRPFFIHPQQTISLEEMRARLQEREYSEQKNALVTARGQFSIQQVEEEFVLRLRLNEFQYPESVFEIVLPKEIWLQSKDSLLEIRWQNGRIEKISAVSAEETTTLKAIVLEPVLVAQLSSSSKEARKTVPLSQIPYNLMKAIVSIEDQRFLDHSGIDPRGIARSIYVNVRAGGYVQGASTITQQMVRNIYLSRDKTLSRKIKEIIMALMIEYKYSKDTILEKYLNEVYFGQSGSLEIHGVAEAAKFYFGKQLAELSLAEQALLAGIVRGPFYYSPYRHLERAKQRQEIVLKKMLDTGAISQSEFKKAMSEPLRFVKASHIQDRAPYFTDMVKAQLLKDMPEQSLIGLGYKIFSTVDTYYQQLAEKAVARQIDELEARLDKSLAKKKGEAVERRILQGTFVALDPLNNELLAIVGGRSYEESNYNRALYMRRHVGSLMKPFVFLAGLIHGANPDGTPMNAVTKLQDSPFTYEYDKQSWSPKNYEGEYLGEVTFRFALAKSLNVPTARLAVQVGLDKVVQAAQAAGIETKLEPLPALSLGAVELTPMEIVQAYSTIANLGKKREIAPLLAVVDEQDKLVAKFVAREESALPVAETANLLELLRGVFEIGTAKISSQMGFQYPTAAGKTGTTNDYRDSWFVGFTPKILAMSWVGFDRDDEAVKQQRKMLKLTGAVGALPIWSEFMGKIHKGLPPEDFAIPSGILRRVKVDIISGGIANNSCSGPSVVEEVFTYRNVPHYECAVSP